MLSDDELAVAIQLCSTRTAKLLSVLVSLPQPTATTTIRQAAIDAGLRQAKRWNITDILAKAETKKLVAKFPDGWKLMSAGIDELASEGVKTVPTMISQTRHGLRKHLSSISDIDQRKFIEEAILCFEHGQNRAAIVLSWVGAAWIIQGHVVANYKSAFNAAGIKRFSTAFKSIRSIKDFGTLQEADLLQLCQDCGMIDKSEKQELKGRLDERNRSGHPNSLEMGDHAAANHLEKLLQNVYMRY